MRTQGERARLFDAMLAELAEKGYEETSIDSAMRRAGLEGKGDLGPVDKDSCLREAYDWLTERLRSKVVAGCASVEGEWPRRMCGGLQALLDVLSARPPLARVLTRLFPTIDPAGRSSYQAFVESFAPLVAGGREFSECGPDLPSEVEMLAVGAAEAIIFDEIVCGRAAELSRLGPAISFSLLVPFIGPEQAAAEMEAARSIWLELEVS
jgi:hypothetical protein